MAIAETLVATPPPLELKENGQVLRVRGTRISLDAILYHYQNGESVEEIVRAYETLDPADVHAIIGYYLRNKSEVDAYLERRQREAEELRREIEARWPSEGLREKLLARRNQKAP